jgi:hypothetical protein
MIAPPGGDTAGAIGLNCATPRQSSRRASFSVASALRWSGPRRSQHVSVHRKHAALDRVVYALGFRFVGSGAEREEKRQEVLVGRMRAHAMRGALAIVEQRFQVFAVELVEDPRLEFARIRRGRALPA